VKCVEYPRFWGKKKYHMETGYENGRWAENIVPVK
jgi:hypothetical protein